MIADLDGADDILYTFVIKTSIRCSRFFIDKVSLNFKRGRIGGVPFLALFNCVFGFVFTQLEIGKFQTEVAAEVRDGGDILERLFQAFIQKPIIGF